jgi:hypothetical protein
VTDDGIGVAQEKLARLFDLFWQDPEAKSRAQGGLGIGLSLAKGLIALHGGTIEAFSAGPALGSQFTIRLPAAFTTTQTATTVAQPNTVPAPIRRILVVDDLRDNADSLSMVLTSLGHETITAYDGSSALAAAAQHRISVASRCAAD